MDIQKLAVSFGKAAQNKLALASEKTFEGALACLETFYFAFNNKNIEVFKDIWLDEEFIQLNNPLGGILYGLTPIVDVYKKIFYGQGDVWVSFGDIVAFRSDTMVTFAGRETGEFSKGEEKIPLEIRTSRIFGYSEEYRRWFMVHHHGSIDNAEVLLKYQHAVKG